MTVRVCGALAVLSVVFFFDTFASRLRMAPAYQVAETYLTTSQELHDAVGQPVRLRRYPRGGVDEERGSAEFRIRVVGEHAAATVQLQVSRIRDGDWRVVEARLTRGDTTSALAAPDERQLQRAASRIARAVVLHDRGHLDEALAELVAAEREDPNLTALYSRRAHVHWSLGNRAAAYADFRAACARGDEGSCTAVTERSP